MCVRLLALTASIASGAIVTWKRCASDSETEVDWRIRAALSSNRPRSRRRDPAESDTWIMTRIFATR